MIPMPLANWRAVEVQTLRVATYTHHREANPTAEMVAACRQSAQALADLGLHVEEAVPPRVGEAGAITHQYWQRPESASADEWLADSEARLSSIEVEQHLFTWDRFRRSLIRFMADYDVILTPAAERPAMPHGADEGWIPYTLPYSLTGWPAVVVRAGTSPEGMPVGVQVVARPWRDDVALAVAQLIEQARGGWRPPNLS